MAKAPTILTSDESLALWMAGREAWNDWASKHPLVGINFHGTDFSGYVSEGTTISFEGYKFPDGDIDFSGAHFGGRDVCFDNAQFGDGYVTFSEANFGHGDIDFLGVRFGDCDPDFSNARFGDGRLNFSCSNFRGRFVSFKGVSFGNGDSLFDHAMFGGKVDFSRTTFGHGKVSFLCVMFGAGHVSFARSNFGDGDVIFNEATFTFGDVEFGQSTFGSGDVLFVKTTFGNCNIYFDETRFGDGALSFYDTVFGMGHIEFGRSLVESGRVAFINTDLGRGSVYFGACNFGEADVDFDNVTSHDGRISFEASTFKGAFSFTHHSSARIREISFRRCRFDGVVRLEGIFACIPDLRSTITKGHVDLQNLVVRPWIQDCGLPTARYSIAPDDEVPALRRLKELSEANLHHDAALRFFADERRAMRWNHLGASASILEWMYDSLCQYGQSVSRPTIGLIASNLIFARLLFDLATEAPKQSVWMFGEALTASIANMLPFIPAARSIRMEAFQTLFGPNPGFWVDILSILQGAIGFVFLFLIGLGLRNRFRM